MSARFDNSDATKPRGTVLLYALLILAVGATALLPFSAGYQLTVMRSRHLQAPSFVSWAPLQFVPTMYNFANRAWISTEPIAPAVCDAHRSTAELLAGIQHSGTMPPGVYGEWLNHYPPRLITFGPFRRQLIDRPDGTHFHFESRYRGQVVESRYVVVPEGRALLIRESPRG